MDAHQPQFFIDKTHDATALRTLKMMINARWSRRPRMRYINKVPTRVTDITVQLINSNSLHVTDSSNLVHLALQ